MKKAQHVVRKGDGRELNRDATSKLGATEQYCGRRGYDAIEDDDDDDDDTATGAGFEEHVDTESPPATPNRLTVAKLPKLVREVDSLIQTLMASPPKAGSLDAFELCASILSRVDEVDAFRQTLRPGPLEAIVRKQVTRLEAAVQLLQSSSEARRNSFLGMQSITPRVVPRSNTRKPRASQKPIVARKHNEIRITRPPKPIYKWERRRPDALQHAFSQQLNPSSSSPLGLRSELRQLQHADDTSHEAALELRPCTEPGHYLRGASPFSVDPETSNWTFEFQLILTEDELKSLKV
ncbi:hypothetical protein Gpo141_00009322 [Globisporangium polare]